MVWRKLRWNVINEVVNVSDKRGVEVSSYVIIHYVLWTNNRTPLAKQLENKTPLFWIELTFKGYEDAMIFFVSIFIFCLEPMVREGLDENDFRHYYGIFFESTIPKLLDHSYVQCSFAKIQGTLTTAFEMIHYSWRFYGHGWPYELIFSLVNIFKPKSPKVPGELSFTQ